MKKESDYLVRNPKLIAEHLTDIVKRKCIITAQFGENHASFLTAILKLDTKNGIIELDCAPTETLNKQLLNSGKALFRTEIDGIKISFEGKGIKRANNDSDTAFEMPIPNAIFWMQRRQFYRVKVPLSHVGSFCEVILRTSDTDTQADNQSAKFRLSDISISGFSLLNPNPELDSYIQLNQSFSPCTLYLHDVGHSSVSFVVKGITNVQTTSTNTQQRIGCFITNITPSFESSILRYMQDIERKMKSIGDQ